LRPISPGLLEIGPVVCDVLVVLDADKCHARAGHFLHRRADIFGKSFLAPGDAGRFIGWGVVETLEGAALATTGTVLRNGADRLARPAPWAGLGFVDSVDRAAHADDLESFVLWQIASYRAVCHIGLGTHHAGDRAVERSGDIDHIERVISRAIVKDGRERANQNQSCQHLTLLHHRLTDVSSLFSGPPGKGKPPYNKWPQNPPSRNKFRLESSSRPSQILPQQVWAASRRLVIRPLEARTAACGAQQPWE